MAGGLLACVHYYRALARRERVRFEESDLSRYVNVKEVRLQVMGGGSDVFSRDVFLSWQSAIMQRHWTTLLYLAISTPVIQSG